MDKNFDLNLLRVLVALDRTRNVTRAAMELNMSQSGFSTALQRLRSWTEDPLFVRAASGMEPTSRALSMIETAKLVLAEVQTRVLDDPVFDHQTAKVEFHLAMADVAEIVFLPKLLTYMQTAAPHVRISTSPWQRDDLRLAMEGGEVDLAIGYFPDLGSSGFFAQRIFRHTYACILRPCHPALRTSLTAQVYGELGHAVVVSPSRSDELFENFLERQHVERRVLLRTPHHLSLPVIVGQTDLIATVPIATADRYSRTGLVEMLPLPFDPPFFLVRQYWHRRVHLDPRVRWLQKLVSRLFNDDTDEWLDVERLLYGAVRSRVPQDGLTAS